MARFGMVWAGCRKYLALGMNPGASDSSSMSLVAHVSDLNGNEQRSMGHMWTDQSTAGRSPVTKPYPPLYVGGGPANFPRIARLNAGWIAISPSPQRLWVASAVAPRGGGDAVTVCQWGEAAAKTGIPASEVERVLLERRPRPRDPDASISGQLPGQN